MNSRNTICSKLRFVYYVQKAVNKGAFLPVSQLLQRFLKTIKADLSQRQRFRYRQYLKNMAPSFGIRIFYHSGKRGKKLFATSPKSSLYNEKIDALGSLAYLLIGQIKQSIGESIKVYDVLKETTDMSTPTAERHIRELKTRAKKFGLNFFKVGRVLFVELITSKEEKVIHKQTKYVHQKNDFSMYIGKKAKDINTTMLKAGLKKLTYNLKKLCFWLTKEVKYFFYDNLKVKYNPKMAYRYIEWCLKQGLDKKLILDCFHKALMQRHADATDLGLSSRQPTIIVFELSSTVSLAKTYIKQAIAKAHAYS